MTELRQVTGAKPMDDTKVFVTFDNGVSGVFDCAPYMEDAYWHCLRSPSFFRQVKAEYGTLCWPNDIDIDPEEVWQDVVPSPAHLTTLSSAALAEEDNFQQQTQKEKNMSKLITHIKRLALALCFVTPLVSWAQSTYSTYSDDTTTPDAGGAYTTGQAFQLKATWMYNKSGDDIASSASAVSLDSIAVKWASGTHGNADIGHNRSGEQPNAYLVVTTPQDVIVGISGVNDAKWTANGTSNFAFTDVVLASDAQYIYYFATDVSGLSVGTVIPSDTKKNGRILGAWHGSTHTGDTVVHINGGNGYSINTTFTVSEATTSNLTTGAEPVALSTGTDPVFVKGAVASGVVSVASGASVPSLTVVGEATTLKLADTLTATYLYLPATTTIDASSVEIGLPGSSEGTKETVLVVGKIAAGSAPAVTLPDLAEGYSYEPLVRDDSGIKAVVSRPVDATVTLDGTEQKWSEVKPEGWVNSAVPLINVDNSVAGTLIFDEDVQAARIHTTKSSAVNFVRGDGVSVDIPVFSAAMTYMRVTFTGFDTIPQTNHGTDENDQITAAGTSTLTSFPQIDASAQGAHLVINQPATFTERGIYVTGSKTVDINSAISTSRLVLGNQSGTTQVVNQNGGSITITGNAGPASTSASVLLGHWNSTSTFKTLSGTFTANNAATRLGWDGTTTWQIGGGNSAAQVNVYGIVNGENGHSGAGTLNIMGNGTLNLGEGGIRFSNSGNGGNINLAGGTINAGADAVTITNAKDGGTIINQNRETTVSVGEGNTMTINAVLSGVGAGTLKKTGAGKLVLAKSGTTNGNLSITEGTAEFNDGVVWTSGSGSVSISEGATLNVLKTEEAAEGELLIAGKFTVNGTVQQNGTQVDVDVRNDGIYIAVPTVTITVPNVDNATVVVSDGASTYGPTTEGGTSYVVPEGATITATYTAVDGYELTGTAVYTINSATEGASVTPTCETAQYIAKIDGGSSYTSLQAAFDAVSNGKKLVLLASTEDGAVVPSTAMAFHFYAGEFECGEIADATGDFVTTRTEDTITIGEDSVKAIKIRVAAVVAVVTLPNEGGVTTYGDPMSAYNAFLAGPAGTTLRVIGNNPFSTGISCTTYDSNSQTYTKLVAYASITDDSFTTNYPTVTEALAAATKGQTVKVIADYTNASGEAAVFAKEYAVTLDLNGCTITGTDGVRLNAAGPLTITDSSTNASGKVVATADDGVALWARNGSAIVNAGTFQNNSISEATVYVGYKDAPQYDNQTVIINGGTFVNLAQAYKYDTSRNGTYSYYALNVLNTFPVAAIQVSAGSFSYDPAKGDDNQGGTFVKSGYASTETSTGVWTVTEVTNPTIDGQPVDPAAVFDTATSAKGITYPTAPTVSGEAGSQTITYKDTEVNVPAYYTASLSGTTVTLTLNSNALPTVGATEASGDDEAVPATEVTDETFGLGLTTTSAKLYYGLATCDTPSGTFADPTTLTKGTGKAMSLTATRGENETVKFYKVFVTDIAPVTP